MDRQAAGSRLLAPRAAGSSARRERAVGRRVDGDGARARGVRRSAARDARADRAADAARERSRRQPGVPRGLPLVRAQGASDPRMSGSATTTATRKARSRSSSPEFTEANGNGGQGSHLHGQPLDDAGRSARARGDAAVLHARTSATRRQPQPRLRLERREGGRAGARAGRRAHRRRAPRRSCGPRARPSRSTSRSRAPPSSTRRRATTSSPAQTEHKATLDTCKRLEKRGCEVTYLPVDKDGIDHARSRSPTR